MIFLHIFLSILINIGLFFIYRKNTNAVLKYLVFFKNNFKNIFCFHAYDQISQIKNHIIFSYKKKFKKYVLVCILALITSLLKSQELDQYFKKKPKKIFCSLLIFRIINLYVKRTPDIKKVVFLFDVSTIRFLPDKIRTSLPSRTFLKP
jgi:hypothetical protein